MCMHMSGYLSHVCGWLRRQERTSDSADLEFQVVLSHPKWVWGATLLCPGRAANTQQLSHFSSP